jgi:hypothetical protein
MRWPRINMNGRLLQEGLNAMAKQAGLQDRIKCVGYPFWSLIKFLDAGWQRQFSVAKSVHARMRKTWSAVAGHA